MSQRTIKYFGEKLVIKFSGKFDVRRKDKVWILDIPQATIIKKDPSILSVVVNGMIIEQSEIQISIAKN